MIAIAQFGPQQIITDEAGGARSVFSADLDGDGDLDVLSASEGDEKVAWYENVNGQGDFGPQQILTQSLEDARDVFAADLDGDGDMDVLAAAGQDDQIVWFNNLDGLGNFGPRQVISTEVDGPRKVHAADLDGDGDMDVLCASLIDYKITWYENLTPLGVADNELAKAIHIYPNPVERVLYINNDSSVEIVNIRIYDVQRRLLLEEKGSATIDVSLLAKGLLFLQIDTLDGTIVKKVIKE